MPIDFKRLAQLVRKDPHVRRHAQASMEYENSVQPASDPAALTPTSTGGDPLEQEVSKAFDAHTESFNSMTPEQVWSRFIDLAPNQGLGLIEALSSALGYANAQEFLDEPDIQDSIITMIGKNIKYMPDYVESLKTWLSENESSAA